MACHVLSNHVMSCLVSAEFKSVSSGNLHIRSVHATIFFSNFFHVEIFIVFHSIVLCCNNHFVQRICMYVNGLFVFVIHRRMIRKFTETMSHNVNELIKQPYRSFRKINLHIDADSRVYARSVLKELDETKYYQINDANSKICFFFAITLD